MAPAFIVEIPEKAEASAVEQTTVKKTGSPKTGVKGVGLAAAMLSLIRQQSHLSQEKENNQKADILKYLPLLWNN